MFPAFMAGWLIFVFIAVLVSVGVYRGMGEATLAPFSVISTSTRSRSQTREVVTTQIAGALAKIRYRIESQSKNQVDLTRDFRSLPVAIATVVLFPLGFVFYFAARRRSHITILMSKEPEGTSVVISGLAPQWVIVGVETLASRPLSDGEEAEITRRAASTKPVVSPPADARHRQPSRTRTPGKSRC